MDPTAIGSIHAPAGTSGFDVPSGAGSGSAQAGGFLSTLKAAITQVNDIQIQAGHTVDDLLTGKTQNIHQAMVALQQADVSFQLMMQVRNKLVGAYEEIQRMQV